MALRNTGRDTDHPASIEIGGNALKRIMLILSLMAIMLVAFSAPVLADEDWWGLDDVTDVD